MAALAAPSTSTHSGDWGAPWCSSDAMPRGRPMKRAMPNTTEMAMVTRIVAALISTSSPSCTFADHCSARMPRLSIS